MKLFRKNRPWVPLQFEEQFIPENYSETGVESGAKLKDHVTANRDLMTIFGATLDLGLNDFLAWLDKHSAELDPTTFVVNTDDGNAPVRS